ncbi:MAG TPA: Xaa-Pro peptidase family protein [Chloroflexota bacterium]|nr:Xaa-Pro peptidase family protein [Chloroflexota bacterium]
MLAQNDVVADLRARLGRVQAAMAERGLGGLLLYASGQHTMLRMDQIMYLADVRVLGPHGVLVVPPRGEPTLLVTPAWDYARVRELTWLAAVEAVEPDELPERVALHASDLKDPLGLGGQQGMPAAFARAIGAALGREPRDADDLVPDLAAARTPVELERIRRAAAIADQGFQALCQAAEPSLREHELAAEVEAAMIRAGAEDNFGLIGAGAHNIAIRAPQHRALERGDVIVGEITPCYQGYLAQLCRTFILGEPTPLQREKYDLLMRAYEAGRAAAVPGRPSGEIARAINEVIGAAGYAEYCRPPYMRTRGHSLGLGAVVPYDLTDDSSPVLVEGMTFIIHPNQYLPDTGYMMLGDTVVIRADGPESLTQTPVRLYWKDA